MSSNKFSPCAVLNQRGVVADRKRRIFKYFAGMVSMDRSRQDWIYEYAETGRPFNFSGRDGSLRFAVSPAACKLQGSREQLGN
jgi:hypothetical protein